MKFGSFSITKEAKASAARKLAIKQDPLIREARKAYRSSPRYELDKLLEEERRWMRKETLARNKLRAVRAKLNEFIEAKVEKTTKGD